MKAYRLYPDKHFFDQYLKLDKRSGALFYKRRPRSLFASDQSYKAWNKRFAGREAGSILGERSQKNVCINKKIYMQHRVVMVMMGWPEKLLSGCVVNHIDGNGLNNKPENLSLTPIARHRREHMGRAQSKLSERYKRSQFPFWHYVSYDPKTGDLRLNESAPEDIAAFIKIGKKSKLGYLFVETGGKSQQSVAAHRLAWKIYYGKWPVSGIDHIDGNPSNNKIDNLREAAPCINMKNKSLYKKNKSGLAGVRYEVGKNTWVAQIGNKKIGRFKSKFDACCARLSAQLADSEYTFRHGRE